MRIRTVKPGFWSHTVMSRQSETAQLLALALLNYSDDEGYFEADVQLVRSALRPRDGDAGKTYKALQDLVQCGYIELREHAERGPLGRVINFGEHQVISRPTPSKLRAYWQKSLAAAGAECRRDGAAAGSESRMELSLFDTATTDAQNKEPKAQEVEVQAIPKAPREPATNNGGIFAAYNEVATRVGWSRVDMKRGITNDRKNGAKRLWLHFRNDGDHFARMAKVREFFEMAGRIPFYLGETGGRAWKADFDFLTREKNIPKVGERFEAEFGTRSLAGGPGGMKTLAERGEESRRAIEEDNEGAPDWLPDAPG